MDTIGGREGAAASGSGYRVRPDGDFMAEAQALLGDAVIA